MRTVWALAFSTGFIAVSLVAAEPNPLAPLQVVRVYEIPEGKGANPIECSPDDAGCLADMKSKLRIVPDLSALHPRGEARTYTSSLAASQREELEKALAALRDSLVISETLIREATRLGVEAARRDEELQKLNRAFEAKRKAMLQAVVAYVELDRAAFGLRKDEDPLDVLGDAFSPQPGATADWIAQRLLELDRTTARHAAEVRAAGEYRIRLAAYRIHPGADPLPVHLDGYDEYEARIPKQIDRITFVVSVEDQARLAQEVETATAVAARIREIRAGTSDLLTTVRDQLETVLRSVAEGYDSLDEALAVLKSHADEAGSRASVETDPDIKKSLSEVETELRALQKAADALVDRNAPNSLRSLRTSLKSDLIDPSNTADRPDLVLLKLLGRLSSVKTTLENGWKTLNEHRTLLAAAQKKLRAQLVGKSLPDVDRLVTAVQRDILKRLLDSVDALSAARAIFDALSDPTISRSAHDAKAFFELNLNDPSVYTIPESLARPVDLEIPRTDPSVGDTIEIVMLVLPKESVGPAEKERPIAIDRRTIGLRLFGWSSNVLGNLVFVRADNKEQADLEPAAAAIWKIGYLERPALDSESNRGVLANTLAFFRPGFGIHVTSLDFDPDNNLEFGAGATLHLWNDLLQVGCGVNLGVSEDRNYCYAGLGVLPALRRMLSP